MKILDANMILRYLINDDEKAVEEVKKILKSEQVLILPEVVAEVVYVMVKFYKYDRVKTAGGISKFICFTNVKTERHDVLLKGLQYFGNTSLDFVDCLLCAYQICGGYEICTFDKKLNNLIKREILTREDSL